MTKSYEFNWQKHLPEFMQEGTSFDRFDEVMRSKLVEEKKKIYSHPEKCQSGSLGRFSCQAAHPDINSSSSFQCSSLGSNGLYQELCGIVVGISSIPLLSFTLNDHSQTQSFVDGHIHPKYSIVVAVGRWHHSAFFSVATTCLHRACQVSGATGVTSSANQNSF